MKIALILAAAALLAAYFFLKRSSGGSARRIEKDIAYGPFTIRATATTGTQINMNYGVVSYTDVAYTVLHAFCQPRRKVLNIS
jgi:hypothetical protein